MTTQEARKLWTDALRSGEYEQGKCVLRTTDNKYCCLGVACEVYQQHVGDLNVTEGLIFPAYYYDNVMKQLPETVATWLGITKIGLFKKDGVLTSLTELNDIEGFSFAQIADTIETETLLTEPEAAFAA